MQTGGGRPGRYWYSSLFAQVLIGIVAGIAVGIAAPRFGAAMKPLGDGFLRLIKMVIGLVVFCTVVSGMSAARDMKKVGRLGGKALIYFEVVSTLALLFGAAVANVVHPGYALDARGTAADSTAVSGLVNMKPPETVAEFLLAIVPNTLFEAFGKGDILPIVFISVLFGYVLSRLGERAASVRVLIEELGQVVFAIINFLMRFAPIGAFGAMAYTLGRFGLGSLVPLVGLIVTFYLTCAAFVLGVLAAIGAWSGFSILRLLRYLKEELLITLGSGSSDVALPALMGKLETLGCSRSVVGLVVPTGFVFNTDGTSIYITLAALFLAQALRIDLSLTQQAALFGVALLTSKGASGIAGAGFIALLATLTVVPAVPISAAALLLGVDRFMGTGRALVNLIGNAVATVVMAGSEVELDRSRMHAALSGPSGPGAGGLQAKVT